MMSMAELGRLYESGEIVVRQGETGNCMFVIQTGQVEVLRLAHGREVRIATLGPGSSFGEMAIFEREVRSATVRTLSEARILTVDKRTFLRRVQEDPTLAFNILRELSQRIRRGDEELALYEKRLADLESERIEAGARPLQDAANSTRSAMKEDRR